MPPRINHTPIFREATVDRAAHTTIALRSRRFQQARRRLAALVKREPEYVSDRDVVEFLARGELATQAYLAAVE